MQNRDTIPFFFEKQVICGKDYCARHIGKCVVVMKSGLFIPDSGKILYSYTAYPLKLGAKMRRTLVIGITVAVIVIIVAGVAAWALLNSNQPSNPSSTPTPTASPQATQTPEPISEQEQIRDAVVTFIQDNHARTSEIMTDLNWTGGESSSIPGYVTYVYCSGDWSVTIGYPVVLNPIYSVNASYTSGDVTVTWTGKYENGAIIETNYCQNNLVVPTAQEMIRDTAVEFIKSEHVEVARFLEVMSWSGGRTTAEGLLGYETYTYTTRHWTFVIGYPVVPNPSYDLTATFIAGNAAVNWTGTYQNGTVTESSYSQNNLDSMNSMMPSTQEQIREVIMNFIENNHAGTATYMQNLSWTGGIVDQGMMVGSSLYNYQSTGWNVTMRCPVVPNPSYTITVTYSSAENQIIAWTGTWQNNMVTEESYSFTP